MMLAALWVSLERSQEQMLTPDPKASADEWCRDVETYSPDPKLTKAAYKAADLGSGLLVGQVFYTITLEHDAWRQCRLQLGLDAAPFVTPTCLQCGSTHDTAPFFTNSSLY